MAVWLLFVIAYRLWDRIRDRQVRLALQDRREQRMQPQAVQGGFVPVTPFSGVGMRGRAHPRLAPSTGQVYSWLVSNSLLAAVWRSRSTCIPCISNGPTMNHADMPENPSAQTLAAVPAKADSPALFDRISPRYDLLNHLLSCGMDVRWRRHVARELSKVRHEIVLDLACGTGDQIITVVQRLPGVRRGVGIDMAQRMLRLGNAKIADRGLDGRIVLVRGDGQGMPVADGSVDCATIAFGIRNMPDPRRCLREFRRILQPGGTLAILEFSLPTNRLWRLVYLFYFRRVLPRLGAAISGDSRAYRYLNRTVEDFPCGEGFCRLVTAAGFDGVRMIPLSGAIATIYVGVKDDGTDDDI